MLVDILWLITGVVVGWAVFTLGYRRGYRDCAQNTIGLLDRAAAAQRGYNKCANPIRNAGQ